MLKLSNQIESFVISDFMEEQQVYCTHQVAEAAPRPHTTLCRCSLGCCCCCCFARRPVRGKASSLLLDGTVKAQAEQLPCYSEQCDVRSHVSLELGSVRSLNSVADAADAPLKWQRRVWKLRRETFCRYTLIEDQFLLTNSNIAYTNSSIFNQQTRTMVQLSALRYLEFTVCERDGSVTFFSTPANVADFNFWPSGTRFSTVATLLRRLHLTLADRLAWSKYRSQFVVSFLQTYANYDERTMRMLPVR